MRQNNQLTQAEKEIISQALLDSTRQLAKARQITDEHGMSAEAAAIQARIEEAVHVLYAITGLPDSKPNTYTITITKEEKELLEKVLEHEIEANDCLAKLKQLNTQP